MHLTSESLKNDDNKAVELSYQELRFLIDAADLRHCIDTFENRFSVNPEYQTDFMYSLDFEALKKKLKETENQFDLDMPF